MAFEWIGGLVVLLGFFLLTFSPFVGVFVLLSGLVLTLALASIQILDQWERGLVLTLGKYSYTLEPGLRFVIPFLQKLIRVDMRIVTTDVPKQEIMTKDNVPVLVNAVVYFKVERPEDAILKIENYSFAVAQFTQAAVRDVIGNSELDTVLTEREKLADAIKKIVDGETGEWGVDIKSIKIQEIELPAEMKRAMAKQAESERERRSRIVLAAGELEASQKLSGAAEKLASAKGALHLRTLQTISEIAADPSEKIVILVPSEYSGFLEKLAGKKK